MAVAAAGVLAASSAGWFLTRGSAAQPAPLLTTETANPPAAAGVLVFVSGAVAHPGLYQLSPDARVADAIAAAGGITSLADPGHLPNLASRVHDGRQVNVPFRKGTGAAALKLDINAAAQDELDAVPGMPPGLGAAIVQFRTEWGPFTTLSQLHTDLGVDTATVTGLRAYLRVVLPAQ
ncbi:MAG: helix-hairpin-helix domain-containing protein [Candidatus Dormibacteraeota bacterium]|nr:helix-hairpin-helix domain-containing protein [Candidatus Dormibacteraeota bacterium]MBV9525005.1 helix-hairpin-helix domain-containing protein [Candidatus Dormibacteraeota bacterium]